MKNLLLVSRGLIALLFILAYAGCETVKVEETLYLGDVDVQAPVNAPPVRVLMRSETPVEIKVSPKLVFSNNKNIRTATGNNFYSSLKPTDTLKPFFREENLDWSFPSVIAGFDIEVPMSSKTFFTGGFHFSNMNNQSSIGGELGLGFGSNNGKMGIRFDAGILIQSYLFQAQTVIKTIERYENGTSKEFVSIYYDNSSTTNINPFVTLHLNSDFGSMFDFYVGAGYFSQSLLGFTPTNYLNRSWWIPNREYVRSDKRSSVNLGFIMLSPGLIVKVMENTHALLGVKVLKIVGNDTKAEDWLLFPSFQVDFQF